MIFQSTQPKRAATVFANGVEFLGGNFNPRSPRGLRRIFKLGLPMMLKFQSTQPKRAATARRYGFGID